MNFSIVYWKVTVKTLVWIQRVTFQKISKVEKIISVFSRHFSNGKSPTITVASLFSSDQIAHPVCATFCALCTFTKYFYHVLSIFWTHPKASNLKYKTQKGHPFHFFGIMKLSPCLALLDFFVEIFKCLPFNLFWYFAIGQMLKKPKGSPFYNFKIFALFEPLIQRRH